MTTDTLMALISKKVPKNKTDLQALRDKFDKFDDKERDELAAQIKDKTTGSNIKAAASTFFWFVIFGAFMYYGFKHEWFSYYLLDGFGDSISGAWQKVYDEPEFMIIFTAFFAVICSVVNYFNLPDDDRKKNLKIIDELMLQKSLNKRKNA